MRRLPRGVPVPALVLIACANAGCQSFPTGPAIQPRQPASTATAVSTATPSPTPTRLPSLDVQIVFGVEIDQGSSPILALHIVTLHDGALAGDRVISVPATYLTAAGHGKAIASGSGGVTSIDLSTGTQHTIDYSGDAFAGALSPDGTTLALPGPNGIRMLDLHSGSVRTLNVEPVGSLPYELIPMRWTDRGIVARASEPEWDHGAVRIDPTTGAVSARSVSAPAEYLTVSPDASVLGVTVHADLGDGPAPGITDWNNTVTLQALGGSPRTLISMKNHDFTPVGVSNDGTLLVSAGPDFANNATIQPDMGLLLVRDGVTTQLIADNGHRWLDGAFVSASQAVVVKFIGSDYSVAEFDLLTLCPPSQPMCKVAVVPLATARIGGRKSIPLYVVPAA